MVSYLVTTSALGLLFAFFVLYLVRRNVMSVPYAIWWLAMALFIFAASIFPRGLDVLGFALGVSYPPILYVVVALLVLALRMLFADLHRTQLEAQLRRLAQDQAQITGRVALLEQILAHPAESLSTPESES